jgi:hypothetical protein
MKLYRVQARHCGAYIDHQVSCETEEQVIPNFINELNARVKLKLRMKI